MTATETRPTTPAPDPGRRAGELNALEALRFAWRQLTSMRTALILLLLLALAAVPGSLIPQDGSTRSRRGSGRRRTRRSHPIYEKLGLFNVYGSPWFAAIYILLVVSLVGCIVPRTLVYARGMRAQPPRAPRHLTACPPTRRTSPARRPTSSSPGRAPCSVVATGCAPTPATARSAPERGYLREVGNLLFHLAVLVVLLGFALGSLFGYKGRRHPGDGHALEQHPHAVRRLRAGQPVQPDAAQPVHLHRRRLRHPVAAERAARRPGPRLQRQAGVRRGRGRRPGSREGLRPAGQPPAEHRRHRPVPHRSRLRPVITVRDGAGNKVYSKPTVFLPQGPDFFSFGVVKAQDAQPAGIAWRASSTRPTPTSTATRSTSTATTSTRSSR